jgi:predicted acyltransferase
VAKIGGIVKVGDRTQAVAMHSWIYEHWFATLAQAKRASFAFAVCYLASWTLLAWGLYRKKIFIKV